MKNKKGQLMENLGALGVGLATLMILLVVTFLIQSEGREQATSLADTLAVTNQTTTITGRRSEYQYLLLCRLIFPPVPSRRRGTRYPGW